MITLTTPAEARTSTDAPNSGAVVTFDTAARDGQGKQAKSRGSIRVQ
jgi:hypothetical protein